MFCARHIFEINQKSLFEGKMVLFDRVYTTNIYLIHYFIEVKGKENLLKSCCMFLDATLSVRFLECAVTSHNQAQVRDDK